MSDAGEFLRKRLEAKLKDPTVIDRVQAEIERGAQSQTLMTPQPWMGADPTIDGIEIPLLRGMLNADGTIAIKGEAAEQLKALIREVLEDFAQVEFTAKAKQISEEWIKRG